MTFQPVDRVPLRDMGVWDDTFERWHREGAFIPMLDHFVPPDVSFETYRSYVERRRQQL